MLRSLPAACSTTCVLLTIGATATADPTHLEVTYLGNEGFHLASGETQVLIDALFGDGLSGYPTVPAQVRASLEAAQPPWDDVDLVLASHRHPDHFDASAVAGFLRASQRTWFVSTRETVTLLRDFASPSDDIESRIRGFWPALGDVEKLSLGPIELHLFHLSHGDVQNLGVAVEICGLTVLHIGDTEAAADEMIAAGVEDLEPDIALIPTWYLQPGRLNDAVERVLRPAKIVAMHMPSADAPRQYFSADTRDLPGLRAAILRRFPDATVPSASGDSVQIPCNQ